MEHGIEIVSNQVCFSLIDRRAAGEMSAFCLEHGVRLLAYGTLAGGFLSQRWLGHPEPAGDEINDWSKMKYKRFVDAIGGWPALQAILVALDRVARRKGTSIANVATRWTLEQPAVAAVIVGARLGERRHTDDNLKVFSFALDAEDRALIDEALARTTPLPGDCGDEYRKAPFLTASGNLEPSSGIDASSSPRRRRSKGVLAVCASPPAPPSNRSPAIAARCGLAIGCSSAAPRRPTGRDEIVCRGDPAAQTTFILDKIAASLAALGAKSSKTSCATRVYLRDAGQWEASRARARPILRRYASRQHDALQIARLIGDYEVEIEAEAVVE